MVDSLKQSDSLKQKALDYLAEQEGFKNGEDLHKSKQYTMPEQTFSDRSIDATLRVVFLWADKKEKEDKSILAKYVYSLEETRGRQHKDIKKRRFELRGKLQAWRDLKQKTKE